MKRLYYFIAGSYVLKIGGEKPLSFINCLKENDIAFRKLKKTSDNEYQLKISVFLAERAMKLAEKCALAEVTVERKTGLPFMLSRNKKRYGAFLGIIIGAYMVYMSQFYLFDVRVNIIDDAAQSDFVLRELEKVGCKPGVHIPSYNVRMAELRFMINNPQYSFVSINVIGNVANVDVKMRDEKPEIIDREGMCDIVAECDGIIISADALQGTPKVKEGDVVSKGDTLISCVTVGRYGTYRLCKAIGSVKAITYREYEVSVPYITNKKEYTGNTETKTSFEIIGKNVDLFFNEGSPFEKCDAEPKKEDVTLAFGIKLPIVRQTVLYKEYVIKQTEISNEDARTAALNDYYLWCEREIKGDIVESETEFIDTEDGVTLKCFLKVVDEIGIEKEVIPGEIIIP